MNLAWNLRIILKNEDLELKIHDLRFKFMVLVHEIILEIPENTAFRANILRNIQ